MKFEEKKNIVAELHQRLAESKVVIVTDYKGLDVAAITRLRRQLREANCDYRVVKNTLMRRASEETDVALIDEAMIGPNAVALSYDDPVAPAKVLTEFARSDKNLEIKIGVMGGRMLDSDAVNALATLPPREVLLGRLLSAMNGVPAAFVRTLNAIPQGLLTALQAVKDQKAPGEVGEA